VTGYTTPEEAARGRDSVPHRYARVVAVAHSPDGRRAVVLIEYNEAPHAEPYAVLCEKGPDGWIGRGGGSAGGVSWMSTSEDGALGVEVGWGCPPTITWDAPPLEHP